MRAALLIVFLTACTQFPELDDAVSQTALDADYPRLLPVPDLAAPPIAPPASEDARIAALKARAARLRGSVVAPKDRARLSDTPG